jgi:hypothetical protein
MTASTLTIAQGRGKREEPGQKHLFPIAEKSPHIEAFPKLIACVLTFPA